MKTAIMPDDDRENELLRLVNEQTTLTCDGCGKVVNHLSCYGVLLLCDKCAEIEEDDLWE